MKKNEQMLLKKNIKIFLDANVLLNYITNREDNELEAEADFIITCNGKDFLNSEVKALSPNQFLNLLAP